jgi:hypothetical protein
MAISLWLSRSILSSKGRTSTTLSFILGTFTLLSIKGRNYRKIKYFSLGGGSTLNMFSNKTSMT